jgi:hypothetical protein
MEIRDAFKKWCPFVRVVPIADETTGETVLITNRGSRHSTAAGTVCLAEDCMAWKVVTNSSGYCRLLNE